LRPNGKHIAAEFIDCKIKTLADPQKMEKLVASAVKKSGFSLIGLTSYAYEPHGMTVVGVIGESHVAVHTYPEAGHASVDVFTCVGDPLPLYQELKKRLKPSQTRVLDLLRGNPLSVLERNAVRNSSSAGFEVTYFAEKYLYRKQSPFQYIEIMENADFGRVLFLDNDLQIAESDAHIYNQAMVGPLADRLGAMKKVAILGGGDGGILYETLRRGARHAVLIDIDGDVVDASQKHLQAIHNNSFADPRAKVVIGDALKYMKKHRGFDAVISDLTMHPEHLTDMKRKSFLDSMFCSAAQAMRPDGVLSMQCCSLHDKPTRKVLGKILKKYFRDIEYSDVFIPSFCERWLFAVMRKKA
jgi:S-adenosylmethionine decarboxylase proenzyme